MKTRQNLGIIVLLVGLVPLQAGCKPLTPEAKQNILNAEKVTCGLANTFLSDPEITALCNFADAEIKPILNLVSAQRVALAKSHAAGVAEGSSRSGGCAPGPVVVPLDGGALNAASVPSSAVKDAGGTAVKDAGGTKEAGIVPSKK